LKEWVRRAGYVNETIIREAVTRLVNTGKVRQVGKYYVPAEKLVAMQSEMRKVLADFHRHKPDQPGMPRETLRQKIKLPVNISEWFLQEAIRIGLAKTQEEYVAAPTHAQEHGQNIEQLKDAFEKMMVPQELIDITPQLLAEKMQRAPQEIKPLFDALVREGILVRLSGVHVYRKTIQYIRSLIQAHFADHETLTVGELRDMLNTSRRMAIPVMEYLDSHNYTKRKDDLRIAGACLKNFSE